jgi:aflatoxin B1 aldehyde reductase
MLEALDKWEALATQQGVSKAELAYRWVYYHSSIQPTKGDFVIVGASKLEQIAPTVEGLERGPLKREVAQGIDEIWDTIKHDAIVDNFDALQK